MDHRSRQSPWQRGPPAVPNRQLNMPSGKIFRGAMYWERVPLDARIPENGRIPRCYGPLLTQGGKAVTPLPPAPKTGTRHAHTWLQASGTLARFGGRVKPIFFL